MERLAVGLGLQLRVLIFSAVILFCDSYDLLGISYAAPYIRADLQLDSGAMGRIFAMAILGMVCGGVLLGPFADRLGPRGVTTGMVLLAGIGTLLLAFADGAGEIMILRFLSGLGPAELCPAHLPWPVISPAPPTNERRWPSWGSPSVSAARRQCWLGRRC